MSRMRGKSTRKHMEIEFLDARRRHLMELSLETRGHKHVRQKIEVYGIKRREKKTVAIR